MHRHYPLILLLFSLNVVAARSSPVSFTDQNLNRIRAGTINYEISTADDYLKTIFNAGKRNADTIASEFNESKIPNAKISLINAPGETDPGKLKKNKGSTHTQQTSSNISIKYSDKNILTSGFNLSRVNEVNMNYSGSPPPIPDYSLPKPAWAWAMADTFWTEMFNYPSEIVDTEIDTENNLYVAGFFSQKMILGDTNINTIQLNDIFCNQTPIADKRTGFIAKISSEGQLLWYRKWNTQAAISDFKYCDITIDNGNLFVVSEFRRSASCTSDSNIGASLLITNETDSLLSRLDGYCKYQTPDTSLTYTYRLKSPFIWVAKFDLSGNLGILTNITELKDCGASASAFDSSPTYGLGNHGYYSIKARNNKLWLLYTWNRGLSGTLRFKNGSEVTDEAVGIAITELNRADLNMISFQKLFIFHNNGALGMCNLEIDSQNNIIIAGSTATNGTGTTTGILFDHETRLSFGDTDYFVAKYNTSIKKWVWAKQSEFILVPETEDMAPSIKLDSQNNIYLAFSMRTSYSGKFANVTFPSTPQNYNETSVAGLLKINSQGEGQWGRLNNHTLRNGRNVLAVDTEDNVYFSSFLNNSATADKFLFSNHRLLQKDLAKFSSVSGTPSVSVYKSNGNLKGTITNIRVYNSLNVGGLVVDSNKGIIISGSNSGKASLGQLNLRTNFGDSANATHNRKRMFISKISHPKSIVLDSASTVLCSNLPNKIKIQTIGDFSATNFTVELVEEVTKKIIVLPASGSGNYVSFVPSDTLKGKQYNVRVSTADGYISGTYVVERLMNVSTIKLPVLSSTLKGTTPIQGICNTERNGYRLQTNITDQLVTLRRNGQVVFTGYNLNLNPDENQTGTYQALVDYNGCRAESAPIELRISKPAEAKLLGSQTIEAPGRAAYLSIVLSGGGEYKVKFDGIADTLIYNSQYQTIQINPTQNTTYTITHVSNYCGVGTVSGSVDVTICPSSLTLQNPLDNYNGGSGTVEIKKVSGEIWANNQISNNSRAIYRAGKSITLAPGFSATNKSVFTAEISGCSSINRQPDADFKLGYQKLHINNGTLDQTLAEMTEFANNGAKMFQITLRFDEVFKSLSQFNETDPSKLNQYWAIYDKVVHHANNLYDLVALRINVDYDDTRYYFQERNEYDPTQRPYSTYENALFDLFGEIVQDQFNSPARIAYGSGHGSFSSTTALAKMKGFVQKTMDRYYPTLGKKIYWVAVVNAAQYETGFNFQNSWDGVNFISPQTCEYDYLPANITAFQNWLVTERYAGIAQVNAAYNTTYTLANQIKPPKVPVSSLSYLNIFNLTLMYNSVLYEDWYQFNYRQMKNFLVSCKSLIKAKSSDIKFCFEAGSCTDKISIARKTLDIPDINTFADILKANMMNVTFGGQHTWEGDMLRSNFTNELQTEINEMDVVNFEGIHDPATVKQKMLEYSKASYLNGAKSIIFMAEKSTPHYNNSLDAFVEIKNWVQNHTEQLTIGETLEVSLSELIRNYDQTYLRFKTLSPALPKNGYQNRPRIIIKKNPQ